MLTAWALGRLAEPRHSLSSARQDSGYPGRVVPCASLSECGVVIIDTAGRSQKDAQRVEELAQFVGAAAPHETHLVLSAGQAEGVLVSAAERFAGLNPTSLIFTKLDEAVSFGALANVAARVGLKLSYLTTGQEVPDQMEVARPDRLARLVLEGELRG